MGTIKVHIVETDIESGTAVFDTTREFSGAKADEDLQKYLDLLHKGKMDKACLKAGVGNYTPAKLTRPAKYSRIAGARESTSNYHAAQQQVTTRTAVHITHL